MNRRDLLKLASVTFATWRAATARPAGLPAPLEELVGREVDWKPTLFDKHQNDTAIALAERIIPQTETPGATDAKVNRYLDLFLAAGEADERRQFLEGLVWLDTAAKKRYSHSFVDCTVEQQSELLLPLEDDKGGQANEPSHRFFRQAKTMTAIIYFNTPEGYRELNKFGPPPTSVECEHAGGHE